MVTEKQKSQRFTEVAIFLNVTLCKVLSDTVYKALKFQ